MKTIMTILLSAMAISIPLSDIAQADAIGVGPRLGMSGDPDQVHFGFHLDIGNVSPGLAMVPNLEVGVGDDVTTVAPSFELDYRFPSRWGSWTPYAGGGVGPVITSGDRRRDDTEMALYAQGGLMNWRSASSGASFFMEFKLGLIESPAFKFTVGWMFGR
jgi:hypothetical protein